jgi:hypothetical protein
MACLYWAGHSYIAVHIGNEKGQLNLELALNANNMCSYNDPRKSSELRAGLPWDRCRILYTDV